MRKLGGKIPGIQNDDVWDIHCDFQSFRMTREEFKCLEEKRKVVNAEKRKVSWRRWHLTLYIMLKCFNFIQWKWKVTDDFKQGGTWLDLFENISGDRQPGEVLDGSQNKRSIPAKKETVWKIGGTVIESDVLTRTNVLLIQLCLIYLFVQIS